MDLAPDRLRTFAAAAQTLNFTQAAKQAYLIPRYFTGFPIAMVCLYQADSAEDKVLKHLA